MTQAWVSKNIWRLLLAATLLLPIWARADYADIIAAFRKLRTNTVLPVLGMRLDDIEETFGPRRQPSAEGRYDWHRGVDIDGANGHDIVAALAGTFIRYTNFTSGGWTVVLRHSFPAPITYQGKTFQNFYTYYMHLDDSQTPAQVKEAYTNGTQFAVTAGQQIGVMGNSGIGPGESYAVHLHFELRVGTQSSLEFQTATYATNSPSYYGFDPHFHPLLLYPPLSNSLHITPLTLPATNQDGLFLLTCTSDDQPVLNRAEISLLDPANGAVVKQHVLDLNQRLGFDATATTNLDARDLNLPYFAPLYFTDAQTNYETQIIVPQAFLNPELGAGRTVRVRLFDIWGNGVEWPPAQASAAAVAPGTLRIAWPAGWGVYGIEGTDQLGPAATWQRLTNQPALSGDRWECVLPPDRPRRFFRLVNP